MSTGRPPLPPPDPAAIPTPVPAAEPDLGDLLGRSVGGAPGGPRWGVAAGLVGLLVLTVVGWALWSLVAAPTRTTEPPVAVPVTRSTSSTTAPPSPTSTTEAPTTPPRSTSSTSPTGTTPPTAPATPTRTTTPTSTTSTTSPTTTPVPIGSGPVGVATQVPPTPRTVVGFPPPVGDTVRLRLEVTSTGDVSDISYGTTDDDDIRLDDQPVPFAVEVTVPTTTGYVYVLGNPPGDAVVRCRMYLDGVLAAESTSSSICIVGRSIDGFYDR